ncbi:MAG TPA: hypothetical protein P5217_01250 [Methanoregulaceae archaeon]|nr:hypothetical protein [Methanoregulaceae archaeon]
MERGDLITIAAGIILVVFIALVIKGGDILPSREGGQEATLVPETISAAGTVVPTPTPVPVQPTINPGIVPVHITYARSPLGYPNIRIPDKMETFGGSDIPWRDPVVVRFAEFQGARGGLSQAFTVPYQLWGMNITVEAWNKPQYARFGMALCSAEDGSVLEGMEILKRGTAFRSVQVSGKPMYLIISTENVDRFRIDFITPPGYFNATQKTVVLKP